MLSGLIPLTLLAGSETENKNTLDKTLNSYEISTDDIYLLGSGDIIELNLLDAEEFSGKFEVLRDGNVYLPLVGSVNVENLSIEQASEKIKSLYASELLRPELFLRLIQARPIKVSIVGEVQRPGIYTLSTKEKSLEVGQQMISTGLPSLINAIQKAGGITSNANIRKVVLKRRLPGKEIKYKKADLDLLPVLFEGNQTNNPYLFSGDIIKITRADELPSEVMTVAKASLSPDLIKINVIGEVEKPGILTVNTNTPLIQAILLAGGAKDWRANKGNANLVRINRNGSATFKKFKVDLNAPVSSKNNPPLMDGDTVYVFKSKFAKATDGINTVAAPLRDVISVWTFLKLVND